MSDRYTLCDAVARTLRALVVGSGSYTYDLSDPTGTPDQLRRVQLGLYDRPPIPLSDGVAFVGISDAGADIDAANLTQWLATPSILIAGWTLGGPSPARRMQAASTLEADIIRALLRNPRLVTATTPTGLVQGSALTSVTLDGARYAEAGQQADLKRMGLVLVTLTVEQRITPGTPVTSAEVP
jgi:hypothetical protein